VLDASAVLAWLQEEEGAEVVDPLLEGGVMSAANWAEVLKKVMAKGADADATAADLLAVGLTVEPLTKDDGLAVARWWATDSRLSLGDRCCLALAERLATQAVTADASWGQLPASVLLIR
jgi:PIN domain nuclease of toxin-antitoxin system